MNVYFLSSQNDLLTEAFGSNKKKKAMLSRLRNKVDNTDLGDTVSEVVQGLASEPLDKTGKMIKR